MCIVLQQLQHFVSDVCLLNIFEVFGVNDVPCAYWLPPSLPLLVRLVHPRICIRKSLEILQDTLFTDHVTFMMFVLQHHSSEWIVYAVNSSTLCPQKNAQGKKGLTRMWANAQPDGRPVEHRWRPLFNAAKFGWRPLLRCAVTLPRCKTRWNL